MFPTSHELSPYKMFTLSFIEFKQIRELFINTPTKETISILVLISKRSEHVLRIMTSPGDSLGTITELIKSKTNNNKYDTRKGSCSPRKEANLRKQKYMTEETAAQNIKNRFKSSTANQKVEEL